MVIVVNIQFEQEYQEEDIDNYFKDILFRLIENQPTHQFYVLSNKPVDSIRAIHSHVTNLVIPARKNALSQKYWMDVKLPLLLRKLGAHVYVATDGIASLTTKVPQCLWIRDFRFLQQSKKEKSPFSSFFISNLPRFLKKAKAVVMPTLFLQETIKQQYGILKEKTFVLKYTIPKEFTPVNYELKESLKALYAHGQEYFIYKGLLHTDYNLVNFLKAFSIFKKRQQSSWKLVLAGTYKEGKNDFLSLLDTYKYKEDVFVTGPLSRVEQAEIIGSAYALIAPSLLETVNTAAWEAMQCGVPVLAAATATNKEIGQDSFLYFDGHDPADMAEKLMQIYKDEKERSRLVESGKQLIASLSGDTSQNALWQGVLLATST